MVTKTCLLFVLAFAPPQFTQDKEKPCPIKDDFTGLKWARTYDEAIAQADRENKILMLKPVDFRSSEQHVSPTFEALRAGPLMDERVANLLKRRFVIFYFDLDEFGGAYSEKASTMARQTCAELRHAGTPPILFYDNNLELILEIDNFVSSDDLLVAMETLLKEHSHYAQLTSEEEAVTDAYQRARIHYELRQFDEADSLLRDLRNSEPYYLRGLIGREKKDWDAMRTGFNMVTDDELELHIEVDRAYEYWYRKDYDKLRSSMAQIGPAHPRYQEAKYLQGLAHFHLTAAKNKNKPMEKHVKPIKAFQVWQRAIEEDPNSAWAVRLDWTLGMGKLGEMISPIERPESMLDRTYLSPNGCPDLDVFR